MPGIGTGVYSYKAAAALLSAASTELPHNPNVPRLEVSPRRIKHWAEGYTYSVLEGERKAKPALQRPDFIPGFLTFKDLVELAWVKAFIESHAKLQDIRATGEVLAKRFGTPYPFAHSDLCLHGSQIIEEVATGVFSSPKQGQAVFAFVEPFLHRIEYENKLAARWRPVDNILVDPGVSFGSPIVESCGIRADILYRSFLTEHEDADVVADWYDVKREEVLTAVHFQKEWLKAA